jgi:DNA-binding NtrC family response regulator
MASLRETLRKLADRLIDDIVESVRTMSLDEMTAVDGGRFPANLSSGSTTQTRPASPEEIARAILSLPGGKNRLRVVEQAVVKEALAMTRGNVSAAARLLGLERKAAERRIARYRL